MSRRLLAVVCCVLAWGLCTPAVAAQAGERPVVMVTTITAAADISPALDGLEVDSVAYRMVAADYERAKVVRLEATALLRTLAVRERTLAVARARAGAASRLAASERDRWDRRVDTLAVRAYVGAGVFEDAEAAGLDPTYNRDEQRALLLAEIDADWRAALRRARADLVQIRTERARLDAEHTTVVDDQERTTAIRADALAEERRLHPAVLDARATAVVVGSDLTLVALDAYLRAALDMGTEMAGCGIPWWLLAGIGRVESGHGTFATSTLDAAGTARPGIVGIALDGSSGTAVITDSDGGAYDGDRRSDRAVGPMQFIPSTWASYASDGNDDGITDPQNLYDAAHAAARYLCTAGGDLSAPAGRHRAIFALQPQRALRQQGPRLHDGLHRPPRLGRTETTTDARRDLRSPSAAKPKQVLPDTMPGAFRAPVRREQSQTCTARTRRRPLPQAPQCPRRQATKR